MLTKATQGAHFDRDSFNHSISAELLLCVSQEQPAVPAALLIVLQEHLQTKGVVCKRLEHFKAYSSLTFWIHEQEFSAIAFLVVEEQSSEERVCISYAFVWNKTYEKAQDVPLERVRTSMQSCDALLRSSLIESGFCVE